MKYLNPVLHALSARASRWLTLALGVSLLGSISQSCGRASSNPSAQSALKVDPEKAYQTIDGFGASGAWWAQDVGGWEDDKRRQIVTLLFDRREGIGLSIYRYNIGAGDKSEGIADLWRRSETFEISSGEYDWTRDASARWVLRAARDAGVEQFVAFANSPPGRMTISGFTSGEEQGRSNLRPEMVGEFARYLVDVVAHLREVEGIPIGYISPVNEPQWDWQPGKGQEGCHFEPDEVLAVTRALQEAIEARELDVKVSVFESGEWKPGSSTHYIDWLLSDPELAGKLDHLAVHSYWSENSHKAGLVHYLDRSYPGTKLWMSEWTEMKTGRDSGMESALVLARTLHEDLTTGGAASWQYWIAVSAYDFRDGLIYVDLDNHDVLQTKRLWAMGNYSRFIRPGFVRVAAESTQDGLLVSAFRSPDTRTLVVVAVNAGDVPLQPALDAPSPFNRLSVYETSQEHNLEAVYHGPPGAFTLPARSVTTFVLER